MSLVKSERQNVNMLAVIELMGQNYRYEHQLPVMKLLKINFLTLNKPLTMVWLYCPATSAKKLMSVEM